MKGLGCALLGLTFVSVLIYPPVASVVVPACIVIWVVAYLSRHSAQ